MSHNIKYFTYSQNVNREQVQKDLNRYAAHEDWQEGCTGLYREIRWLDGKVFDTEETARAEIERIDRRDYDQLAVLFNEYEPCRDERATALDEKCAAARDEYNRRSSVKYSDTVTAALITCKKCGSKLARTYIRTNRCPVCQNELRPEYMLKSVEAARNKWERACREKEEFARKHGKKNVRWLVKIEYHT